MRALIVLVAAAALTLPAAARSWAVDPERSTLGFEVAVQGDAMAARLENWSAEINFDPSDLGSARAKVTISLASVDSGDKTRDDMMTSQPWFDVEASGYTPPDGLEPGIAVFETHAFRVISPNAYEADGTLTLRGIAKPLTLPFTLLIEDNEAHLIGAVTLNRTQWGVGQGEFAGGTPVATEVKVTVDLVATAD